MTDVEPARDGELSVVMEAEGLLVAGDPDTVRKYIDKLRFNAVDAVQVAGVDAQSATAAAALATGLAAVGAQHGTFVRIDPKTVSMMRMFKVVPGDDGFSRMTLTDAAGRFVRQAQWQRVSMTGTQALAVQMTVTAIALQTTIASTAAAIERVEGKTDAILALVKASTIGDVLGHHQALVRIVGTLDETGQLPTTDWEAVAALGPTLEVVVERLRSHIGKTLEGFDASAPVQDRAKYLQQAVRDNHLGESLELLVVAEQSLYLWQRLRIERVRTAEPEHLELAVRTARQMLAEHLQADGQLLVKARAELASYAAIKPLEIARWMSGNQLKRDITQLREDLDNFATARRSQVQGWQDHEDPRVKDALVEIGNRFKVLGGSARAIGSRGVDAGAAGIGLLGRKLQGVAERRRTPPPEPQQPTSGEEAQQ